MEPETLLDELRGSVVGRRITFTRLAATRLILYLDCEPGDEQGIIIACDPPWQVCDRQRVIVGSSDAYRTCDDREAFDLAAAPLDTLHGHAVAEFAVDARSRDLTLVLEDGSTVKTLADEAARGSDSEFWHIRDVRRDWTLYSQISGWSFRQPRA